MNILIFDSGVGGLSIFDSIRASVAHDLIYLADHAAYPYGDKAEDWLVRRVVSLLTKAHKTFQADLIVVACNTASTIALPELRQQLPVPIIGVVPAIKTAAQVTNNNRIGLLATPGTVSRPYIDNLISSFASNCDVFRLGTTELVHMAEKKLSGQQVNLSELELCIAPLIKNSVDCIVLGCTHFPLLEPELKKIHPSVKWVDSGEAIARRASELLPNHPTSSIKGHRFYSTIKPHSALVAQLASFGFSHYEHYPMQLSETL